MVDLSALEDRVIANLSKDKNKCSIFTEGIDGHCLNSYYYFKNYHSEKANIDNVLYILDDVNKKGTEEIVFKDFRGSEIENPNSYHIQLVPTFEGKGKNVKSSFFIMIEKQDADGNVIARQKVGSPEIKRKGITDYKIERIFCDNSEKSLIFVIEKTLEDDTGISIRYMVEAAKL